MKEIYKISLLEMKFSYFCNPDPQIGAGNIPP
jgi:hypothetical protein